MKRYQCKACGHCCTLTVPDYVDDPCECPYHSGYYTAWQLLKGDDGHNKHDIPAVTGYSQRWIYKTSLTYQGVDINP